MPPRGVKKGSKRDRQYKEIVKSEKKEGRSTKRAKEIAARSVNKEKARSGESKSKSKSSTKGSSASSRGGKQSGKGPGGRTREQLYNDAKKKGIEGRSKMSKKQLEKAVAGASCGVGGSALGSARPPNLLLNSLLQLGAGAELRHRLRGDLHRLAGARVAPGPCRALGDGEFAEARQPDLVPLAHLLLDRPQRRIERALRLTDPEAALLGNVADQLILSYDSHMFLRISRSSASRRTFGC
jgi:hypothetical protein